MEKKKSKLLYIGIVVLIILSLVVLTEIIIINKRLNETYTFYSEELNKDITFSCEADINLMPSPNEPPSRKATRKASFYFSSKDQYDINRSPNKEYPSIEDLYTVKKVIINGKKVPLTKKNGYLNSSYFSVSTYNYLLDKKINTATVVLENNKSHKK